MPHLTSTPKFAQMSKVPLNIGRAMQTHGAPSLHGKLQAELCYRDRTR